jgi:hypothetical protein
MRDQDFMAPNSTGKDANCSALILTADLHEVMGQRHKDIKMAYPNRLNQLCTNIINPRLSRNGA